MDDAFAPIENEIDVRHMQRSVNLLVFGLGRVARIFILLAAFHGVRWIRAIDNDWIFRRNFASGFPESGVGTSKIAEMKERLSRESSRISFDGATTELHANEELPETAGQWLRNATHVAFLIDSFDVTSHLADRLYEDLPCVYASVLEGGMTGESAWQIPGQTPCLNCVAKLPEKQGASGGRTLLVDVFNTVNTAFRQFMGLCLVGRKGFDLFAPYVNPHYCLAITMNRPGGFVDLSKTHPDVPSGVKLVEVIDADGNGPSCTTCNGYIP